MSVRTDIRRFELPSTPGQFTIDCHGVTPLCIRVEGDVPVMYEIACTSPDDDKPYPHTFRWMQTGEEWPPGLHQVDYCGTVQLPNGIVLHLFRIYE